MKLVLDWDEDTIDAVAIAIGAHMCDMQEELDRQREIHIHLDKFEPRGCVLDLAQITIDGLRRAMGDLLDEPGDDGIFPVKELLGSHEARIPKEGP